MSDLQTQIPTDQWVKATWEEYLEAIANPAYEKARGYYHNGRMRIEMAPIGFDHSSDNTTVTLVASLFGAESSGGSIASRCLVVNAATEVTWTRL